MSTPPTENRMNLPKKKAKSRGGRLFLFIIVCLPILFILFLYLTVGPYEMRKPLGLKACGRFDQYVIPALKEQYSDLVIRLCPTLDREFRFHVVIGAFGQEDPNAIAEAIDRLRKQSEELADEVIVLTVYDNEKGEHGREIILPGKYGNRGKHKRWYYFLDIGGESATDLWIRDSYRQFLKSKGVKAKNEHDDGKRG